MPNFQTGTTNSTSGTTELDATPATLQPALVVTNQNGWSIEATPNPSTPAHPCGGIVAWGSHTDALRALTDDGIAVNASSMKRGLQVYGHELGTVTLADEAMALVALTDSAHYPAIFANTKNWAAWLEGRVLVRGDLIVTGTKHAVVDHPDGSHRLLYCLEAPEAWYEDFGRASLRGGKATVTLEAQFAALVGDDSYHVFLTPEGECEGLYVARQSRDRFEVHELRGGNSDISFSYRIAVKRTDVEAGRFKSVDLPERLDMTGEQQRARNAEAELRQRIDSLSKQGFTPDKPG